MTTRSVTYDTLTVIQQEKWEELVIGGVANVLCYSIRSSKSMMCFHDNSIQLSSSYLIIFNIGQWSETVPDSYRELCLSLNASLVLGIS